MFTFSFVSFRRKHHDAVFYEFHTDLTTSPLFSPASHKEKLSEKSNVPLLFMFANLIETLCHEGGPREHANRFMFPALFLRSVIYINYLLSKAH